MKSLKVDLQNCFGIEKLENQKFSFENSNINLIYAKNGSMKTSFTKVFEKFQLGQKDEVKDLIHNKQPIKKEIIIMDKDDIEAEIKSEDIFVIKSFVPSYESGNIATLLVNDDLKNKISEVLKLKTDLLKKIVKQSGIKISGTSGGKTEYKLEPQILSDFNIQNESFLKNLDIFWNDEISHEYNDVKYSEVFEAIDIIKSDDFQNNIKDFLEKSDKIYSDFTFLDKGRFTLGKLKKVQTELKKQSFFVKENKIKFGDDEISETDLKTKIIEIEKKLQDTEEFKKLEKLLQKPKGIPIKDVIENNSSIIEKLKLENLENFKKELWQCYFQENKDIFNNLKIKFQDLESEISALNVDDTAWREAINLFNDRFFLPFRMDISNLESSVMGENLPKVIFKFPKDGDFDNNDPNNWEELDRKDLEGKDVLSQGEKRALYLLNIIFEIEVRKKEKQKTLFIIDDIADSFDYKNKYAIVEYLRDLSQEENFYSIILTHNFDFFRFLSNRLKIKNDNKLIVTRKNDEIILNNFSEDEPWKKWKNNLNEKNIISLIPFVRNLIEYGKYNQKYFLLLTHLLHIKSETFYDKNGKILRVDQDNQVVKGSQIVRNYNESEEVKDFRIIGTKEITFKQIEEIYKEYLGIETFNDDVNLSDNIFEKINSINLDENLGDKIIYGIKIRYESEEFMIKKINNNNFVYKISSSQTNELFQKLKGKIKARSITDISDQQIKILESVNIMTPENIHLNSFMYEPILDMGIVELKELYQKISSQN